MDEPRDPLEPPDGIVGMEALLDPLEPPEGMEAPLDPLDPPEGMDAPLDPLEPLDEGMEELLDGIEGICGMLD